MGMLSVYWSFYPCEIEATEVNIRSYIFIRYKVGFKVNYTQIELESALGTEVPRI